MKVDGIEYEWFWDRNDLVLTSEPQGLIFPMAKIELVDQAIDDKMGNHLLEYLHDEDNIEWFVNKHKDTATVINNYEV